MRLLQSLSRRKRYLFFGLMVLLILLLISGFFRLQQTIFAHSQSPAVASPTGQATMTVPSPTTTPSPIVASSPTASSSPTTEPSPTATSQPIVAPSPTAKVLPTATPSPTPKPSPAILAATPNTIAFDAQNLSPLCTPLSKASYECTFTLSNSSNTSTLAWTAKAWDSHGVDQTKHLGPTGGTLPRSGTAPISLFVAPEGGACSLVGTTVFIQLTGPANSVTVTVTC